MKHILIIGILIAMSFSANAEKGELKPESECLTGKRMLIGFEKRAEKYEHEARVNQEMFDVIEAYMSTLEKGSPKYQRAIEGRNAVFKKFDKAYDKMEDSYQKRDEVLKRLKKHCYKYFKFDE